MERHNQLQPWRQTHPELLDSQGREVENHRHKWAYLLSGQMSDDCAPFYKTHELGVETKEEAQAKAVELVRMEVNAIVADLD